jgi:ectoine hydroxylase-related dioxygenase (phytanoyl-CoA dioxygenase family)
MATASSTRSSCGKLDSESACSIRNSSTKIPATTMTVHSFSRREPAVLEAFAHLWGTSDLLVSFDGMNITLPSPLQTKSSPWPHVDQSPTRRGLQCVQGILNLAPNGPDDGGLLVYAGSHALNEQFFETHNVQERPTWGSGDWFGFTETEVEWYTKRGCELRKVCAEPGDLIVWDSRTVHFNETPRSQNLRAVICTWFYLTL